MLEEGHPFKCRYSVKTSLAGVRVVVHRQLLQTVAALELLQHPNASLDNRRSVYFVADMRGAKSDERVELLFEIQQARQGRPDDDSSQAMPHK